ncbi:MAG: 16S rRNA (guanine(966)-N(2))-methyltransferase RsmD [Desulfobacteraceae bacterium]|nr:16S rRNA (guanine(966)-N(2))-methyltransferase RsmD [Desulfobacteraceae bacterium]
MRVISGRCKGRKLNPIQGSQIRPTSDRVKEAIFNILGQKIKKARVLDLFAGTGALGIEALSRGAHHATFIDQSCDILLKNLELCRFEDNARVISYNLAQETIPESLMGKHFDLIFIDPPYGKGFIEHTLEKKYFSDLLNEDGVIIAEHSYKETPQIEISTLDIFRQKKYSKTIISFINKLKTG